jgi:hypothetical protein
MQRMQANLDDTFAERSELSKLLDEVQRKRHRLEEERAGLQRTVDAFFLPPLGGPADVPIFLRTEHPVVARNVPREKVQGIVQDFYRSCTELLDAGTYPDPLTVFKSVVRSHYEEQAMAEVRPPPAPSLPPPASPPRHA